MFTAQLHQAASLGVKFVIRSHYMNPNKIYLAIEDNDSGVSRSHYLSICCLPFFFVLFWFWLWCKRTKITVQDFKGLRFRFNVDADVYYVPKNTMKVSTLVHGKSHFDTNKIKCKDMKEMYNPPESPSHNKSYCK